MTLTENPTNSSLRAAPVARAQGPEPNEYAQLRDLIKNAGLLEKSPGHYAIKLAINLSLLALSVGILTLVDSLWVQMLNAAFLAFIMVQLCFLGHDLGHKQVFRSSRNNDLLGLFVSFLVGINRTWWVEKHNEHHSNPNDLDMDPDINLPLIAFSEGQALEMKGLFRLVVKYQAFLFYPLVCFEGFVLKVSGVQYVFGNKLKFPVLEPLSLAVHLVLYVALVFLSMPVWEALLFAAVNQLLLGLYIGSTFAPNHKGMLILDSKSPLDYLRKQVMTSRNIKSSRLNDYLYGGLNYQIEHHLFPNMPRNRLKEAQKIVMPYCKGHSISYYETGIVRSQREILQFLHQVSAPLRA